MLEKTSKILNKFNIDNIILKIILLLPISTVIQGLPLFSPINKVIIAILILFLCLGIVRELINKKDIITITLIIFVSFSSILGIILCKNFNFNINNLFFYPMFGFFTIYLINNSNKFKKEIKNNNKTELIIILIWSIIVFISFFFKSSYNTAWGGNKYFVSFSEGVSHRFASSCCFILILVLALIKQNKNTIKKKIKIYLLAILPTLGVLLSGARIYLIVAILILTIGYYIECKTKKIFWITIIPLGLFTLLAIMLTPMGTKIIATATDPHATNLLSGITSGRSEFWVHDLKAFFNQNIIFQIFGSGVSFVFDVNLREINLPIYAHNDYINILLTYGYFGLFHYILLIVYFVKSFYNKTKPEIFTGLCTFGVYFMTAFLNGFYVYPCTLLSLPIIMYCIEKRAN